MAGSTTNHGIGFPEATDLVKDPATPAKLADDIRKVAVGADNALAVVEYRAKLTASADATAKVAPVSVKADTALTNSTLATASAMNAVDRVKALEAAAGFGPSTPTDGTMASYIANPESLTAAQLSAMINGAIDHSNRNETLFFPEDYWNSTIEPVNYKWTFERVIQAANGNPIILQSGKEYPVADTVTNYGATAINMQSSGAEPAYITSTGQSLSNLMWLQPGGGRDEDGGVIAHETTLSESIGINGQGWLVANATGIVPGMICAVISSKLWYHDPRPGLGEARKSELHRVSKVVGSRVYFDDVANDGYNIATETVTLKFYNPITVRMDNITFRAVLPAPAESTSASIGLRVDFSIDPKITNVSVENCARTGIYMAGCYAGTVRGGYTHGANNYFNGYGVSVAGSAYFRVTGRVIKESRRGVDFSNIRNGVISRQCFVDNSYCLGGGKNSRGEDYGWLPDGSNGAYQGGFGSHGGVDTITYRDCYVSDMHAPFTTRGRTSIIDGGLVLGRTTGGTVWSSYSTNLYVSDLKVLAGYWSLKDHDSYIPGNTNIHQMRADTLVTVYGTWEGNPATPYRGQIVITNNEVEVRAALVRFYGMPIGEVHIAGNRAMINPVDSTTNVALIDNRSGIQPSAGTLAGWYIGPNAYRRPTGSGTITETLGLNLAGANVVRYTVAT